MMAQPRNFSRTELLMMLGFVLLLILILAPILAFSLLRAALEERVDQKLAELERAGYPMTLVEANERYLYPTDGDNAAFIYESAFPLLADKGELVEGLPPWLHDGWPELGERLPLEWAEQAEALFAANAGAMERFHEASQMQSARFDVNLALGWDLHIPHVGRMRSGARILFFSSVWRAEQGDWDAAVRDLESLFATGNALRDEPLFVSQLTRMAIRGMGCQAVERILATEAPPEEFLFRVQAILEREANDELLLNKALQSEIAFGNLAFEWARTHPEKWAETLGFRESFAASTLWIYWFTGYLARDHEFYLDTMAHHLRAANSGFPERLSLVLDQNEWEDRLEEAFPPMLISSIMTPTISRVFEAEAVNIAEIRLALMLVALERFRFNEGRLPETLGELVPIYLQELPIDPFSGDAFDYERDGAWVIVGSDGEGRDGKVKRRIPADRP